MSNEIKYVNEAGVRRIITDTRDHIADVSEAAYTGHDVVLYFPAASNTAHTKDSIKPYYSNAITLNEGQSGTYILPYQIPDNYDLVMNWDFECAYNILWQNSLPSSVSMLIDGSTRTVYLDSQSISYSKKCRLKILQKAGTEVDYILDASPNYLIGSVSGYYNTGSGSGIETHNVNVNVYASIAAKLPIHFTSGTIEIGPIVPLSSSYSLKIRSIGGNTYSIDASSASVNIANTDDETYTASNESILTGPIVIKAVKFAALDGFTFYNEGH